MKKLLQYLVKVEIPKSDEIEASKIDRWWRQPSEPQRKKPFWFWLHSSLHSFIEPIEAGEKIEWFFEEPEYIIKKKDWRFIYPSIFNIETPIEELESIGRWRAIFPDSTLDKKKQQHQFPYQSLFNVVFTEPTPIPELSWQGVYPNQYMQHASRTHMYDQSVFHPEPITAVAAVLRRNLMGVGL